MARPRTPSPSPVAVALAAAHAAAGAPPFASVRDAVKEYLGAYTPTEQTIRSWHGPDSPKKLDPLVLTALADVYGVELASLDPTMERQLPRIKELISRSRCFSAYEAA